MADDALDVWSLNLALDKRRAMSNNKGMHRTFTAFGATRVSAHDRHWASMDSRGTVRFHATQAAAHRAAGTHGHVTHATVSDGSRKRTAATRVCDRCNGTRVDPVKAGGTVTMPCQRCAS